MDNQDFYNMFSGVGATQSPASIMQNVNLENELGTMQKSPKLMSLDEYSGWSGRFKNWVQANHLECWMKIECKYVPPMDGLNMLKTITSLTEAEQIEFKAEKKMVSILQQAIKEDILVLLQHDESAQSIWQALEQKFKGSASMIKSKKALIKKEFDIFAGIKGESTKQLIERYCHLVVEMRRLNIEKTNEEWIDKLCDALPYEEWGTYLMMLKNSSDFVNYSLSVFIEKIEAHELELVKIKKMNSANMPQDVSLYYKNSPTATNVQSPKIQTGLVQTTLPVLHQMLISQASLLHFPTLSQMLKFQNRIRLKVLQVQTSRHLYLGCSVTLLSTSRMEMRLPRMQPSNTSHY
ncbi:hypothetical protein HanIR_Chr10g0465811 [Helianthus annuus]|nr:hypothetical protein HanIR_Chr10g0465811 [Helianthus annuus]